MAFMAFVQLTVDISSGWSCRHYRRCRRRSRGGPTNGLECASFHPERDSTYMTGVTVATVVVDALIPKNELQNAVPSPLNESSTTSAPIFFTSTPGSCFQVSIL